jgi:hypothetical protein
MFKSQTGLFLDIYCPGLRKTGQCLLPNCIFSHTLPQQAESAGKREPDCVEKPISDEPVLKKAKANNNEDGTDNLLTTPRVTTPAVRPPLKQNLVINKLYAQQQNKTKPVIDPPAKRPNSSEQPAAGMPESLRKPALSSSNSSAPSPASNNSTFSAQNATKVERTDAKTLVAQPVTPYAPATHQQRMDYLRTIFKELELKKVRFPRRVAMKLEHNIAKSSSKVIYPKNIRKLVADIRADKFSKANQEKVKQEIRQKEAALKVRYKEELEKLIIPTHLLESNNYTVGLVVPNPVGNDYVASCERCGIKFQPSNSKTHSTCVYHWARLPYDLATKKRSNVYPCCSERVGESSGCSRLDKHVYKLTESQNLAAVIPFVTSPSSNSDSTLFAAGIDCEMAYTTYGTELIRVTVVDWDTGHTVLDRMVFPLGEIVDLNTHFSGIADINAGVIVGGTHYPTISFSEARNLLFKFVSTQTILIGHGLENDLNTLRLLHTQVVDTAIRYPTLNEKRKHSLKSLAHTYLGRTIQTGEHDSAEDALAAMDIVKANIKKTIGHIQ